jgi:hypothetical protein
MVSLIGLLGFGMMIFGCDNGTTSDDKTEDTDTAKVVAEKYRGTWECTSDQYVDYIVLTEEEGSFYRQGQESSTVNRGAYTIGTDLYLDWNNDGNYSKDGSFTSDTNLDRGGSSIYIKQ